MIWSRIHFGMRGLCLMLVGAVALLTVAGSAAWAAEQAGIERYKMRSVLEYSGNTQFSNNAEALFTVQKRLLPDGRAKYDLSSDDMASIEQKLNSGRPSSFRGLSFVIDRKTQHLSTEDGNLALLERVTNRCVKVLSKTTKDNVGKTWKQSFDLASIDGCVVRELTFTLTAMSLQTDTYGDLVAVRALSEPFFVQTTAEDGSAGKVQCRMNCAYVFSSDFEDILLSASVFAGSTSINGLNEKLKHTVTTWKVDASGEPLDFSKVGENKSFAQLVGKLGVSKEVEVVESGPLPQWARADGIRAAQVANICGATSCEGALNPVATICLPVAGALGLQSLGDSTALTSSMLAVEGSATPTGGGGGSSWWPLWPDEFWQQVVWGTGIGFGVAGASGAFDDDGTRHRILRSPTTP